MILQKPIFFTLLIGVFTLFLMGESPLLAQLTSTTFNSLESAPMVVAKKTTSGKGGSSPLTVNNVRHHRHKKYTRVVLDLPAKAIIRESKNANTVTIELAKSQLSERALQKIRHRKFPKAISIQEGAKQTVTITLDLNALKNFDLQTLKQPNRVVIDLFYSKKITVAASKKKASPDKKSKKPSKAPPQVLTKKSPTPLTPKKKTVAKVEPATQKPQKKKNTSKQEAPASKPTPPTTSETPSKTKPTPPASPISVAKRAKDLIVVIDPGHGGKDPGAIGKKGTKEKDVTLKIGNYLKDLIQKRIGATVVLTRNKDVFLDLEKRVELANRKKADLFISIHVNSHPQQKIKGLEVYHFGKASDPRALEVAARENGMKLEDNAPPWQFIIADKLNDQKIEQSQTFAWTTNKTLVTSLKASYKVKDHGVKTAPFYVLRFTTMPSILAEVAFVSNPDEEKRLKTTAFQRELAEGMFKGIQSYLKTAFPTLS